MAASAERIWREHVAPWWTRLRPERFRARVSISAAVHIAVLYLLVNGWWIAAHRFIPPGNSHGTRMMLTYNAGKPIPPQPPQPKRRVTKTTPHVTAQPEPLLSPVSAPVAVASDASGSGQVGILYVSPFPNERPDLSGAGTTGDVIVDVQIDPHGQVAQAHTRKGMNSGVDAVIMATVEQWVFQPALRNGQPVASTQELHFHYDGHRNPSGCGWECFALEDR